MQFASATKIRIISTKCKKMHHYVRKWNFRLSILLKNVCFMDCLKRKFNAFFPIFLVQNITIFIYAFTEKVKIYLKANLQLLQGQYMHYVFDRILDRQKAKCCIISSTDILHNAFGKGVIERVLKIIITKIYCNI